MHAAGGKTEKAVGKLPLKGKTNESVEPVHGPVRPLRDQYLRSVTGTVQRLHQHLLILAQRAADDPVHHVIARLPRSAYPHLDAGELIGSQMLDDVLQAVVAAGTAAGADAELPTGREISSEMTTTWSAGIL